MNIEKTNNKSYSSWKKLLLKDFCKKCIVKNTDKKHSLVFTNSAIYGIVKQADYFEKNVANSDNTDSYYVVNTKDFIYNPRISENAPYGPIRTNETGEVGIVSPLYFVFRIADETIADYNFLKYYFTSSNWHRYVYSIGNNGARSDRMNISDADFMAMPVALPPLEEQRRIAEILGCCDRVITLKKELIAEKKKQKKALMQKLLNPDSGFRLPGFSGEWKSCNLGCFGECIRGVSYQPSEDLRNNYSSETYTLLRANNFGQSELNMSEVFFVDKKCVSSEQEIISGDILISMSSGSKKAVGKITLITNIAPKTCVGAFCAIFRSKNSNFLKHFFETRDYQQQLSLLLEGTNINNLTPQEIENLKVNIPDNLKEQQAIADILSAADKEIDLLEQELAQQEQKKKSLMQLLLTGIVRV